MMQRRAQTPPDSAGGTRQDSEDRTPHEQYAEASAALAQAELRVRALADQLMELGQSLTDAPLTTAPLHEAARDSLPLHIATHPFRAEIDLANWPDAGDIIDALANLHAARTRVLALRAWMLPQDRDATPEA